MAKIQIQRLPDGPLETVDDSLLVRMDGGVDNDHECTTWVEYRFPGEDRIVHRSVHVTLKEWPTAVGTTGTLG